MPHLLSCPRGHHWEAAEGGAAVCPVCGAETREAAPSSTATLPLPGRAAPEAPDKTLPTAAAPEADASAATLAPPAAPASHATLPMPARPPAPETPTRSDATRRMPSADDDPTARVGGGASAPPSAGSTERGWRPPGAPAAAAGPVIPGYRILAELGRGGMGVVYKAEQIGLNRLVAVKMILSGDYAGSEDLARFRLEAEAAAKLQHPHIVQVFEIDEVDGRPYFCLEYVDGGPLDKTLAAAPQPFRRAAELVEKLARAMAYAHGRGIIHRDLKPPNVLLTAAGEPKITDFGLAKRLDSKDSRTQSGSVMGTPSYMAPEQAFGRVKEIGPASDIYSLGAVLYEALVGRPPFKGETALDTLDQVRTLEPPPPSRLRPKVPRDLETICLKCLQKDPRRRYASAAALADDLRRYLGGEPIRARPTPAWERAWKWVRRRPAAAALAGVVMLFALSLIGGGVAFGDYQWRRAEEEARLKHAAEGERDRAERNYHYARDAVEQMLTQVAEARLEREPGKEQLRRLLLTRAQHFYEEFLRDRSDDRELRLEAGRAYRRVGDIEQKLGEHAGAEAAYRSALDVFDKLRQEVPGDVRYREELAVSQANLGELLQDAGRTPEAEQTLREARDLAKQVGDESDRWEDRLTLAHASQLLGGILRIEARFAEAESCLHDALQARAPLVGPSLPRANRLDQARGYNNLGELRAAEGRADDARQSYQEALDILTTLLREEPDKPDFREELAVTHNHLGNLWRDGDPAKAEEEYRECLRLRGRLARDFPSVPAYRQQQAAADLDLGLLRQAAGRQDEAEQAYQEAMTIAEGLRVQFPDAPDCLAGLGRTWNDYGIRLQNTNRLKEAEVRYDEAREVFERLAKGRAGVPAYRQELANTLQNLGVLYEATNRPDKGGEFLGRSADLRRQLADDQPRAPEYQKDVARADMNLGNFWQMSNDRTKAEGCYKEALDRLGKLAEQYPAVPDYRHLIADASKNYGLLLRTAGRADEAEARWNKSVDLLTALGDEQPTVPIYRQELARTLNDLGTYLASAGRASEAEKVWARLLGLQQKLADEFPKNPVYREELAVYHENLGALYQQGRRFNQAEASYRQAAGLVEGLEKADPDNPVYWNDLVTPYSNLVNLLSAEGLPSDDLASYWDRLAGVMRKRAAAFPKVSEVQGQAGFTLAGLASWLRTARKPEGARDALKEAVGYQRAAADLRPQDAGVRAQLCDDYLALADVLLDLKDHAGAAGAVGDLAKAAPADWPKRPAAAGRLAHSAGLAAADDALAPDKREELAKTYGDRAMDLLRQAAAHGFKDASYLRGEKDFDALRPRDDFQKILSEMDKK